MSSLFDYERVNLVAGWHLLRSLCRLRPRLSRLHRCPDGSLVAAKAAGTEDIIMLNNGCLCCTVHGDLVRMISELVDKKGQFDHIVRDYRVVILQKRWGVFFPASVFAGTSGEGIYGGKIHVAVAVDVVSPLISIGDTVLDLLSQLPST